MSVYERRYEVHIGQVSHYVDDPVQALRLYESAPEGTTAWIKEGYGDIGYQDEHVTEVIRRTTGRVLPSTLRYQIERAKVEKILEPGDE